MDRVVEQRLTPEWAGIALKELKIAESHPSRWQRYFYVVDDGWQRISPRTAERIRQGGRIVISYKGMVSLYEGIPPRSECLQAWKKLAKEYTPLSTPSPIEPHWDRWEKVWIEHSDLFPPTDDKNRWITRTGLEMLIQGRHPNYVMPEF